ncbi:MAG: ABC transporter ATP-binding protein [Lachnospiraceae bacterium]|jgi:ABC-2 type transport system ATP-binding protein|nr:ABC transporter ATP-binding protein [Lachnospiraceae bacterium]
MDAENAITVENLTKVYDGFTLKDVSFKVPAGSVVGFIGENGAGKSTTIKALLGLIPVDKGQVEVLGHKIFMEEKDVTWREQIGVVFDECNFPLGLKGKDVQNMLKNIYRTWDAKKFRDYMDRFEIPMNKKIKDLSKGMKMKLSIAAALSHDSRLLILDEATSGLDPVVRSEILDIFREFIEDEQHTIFLSSHITSDIEKIADYVMLIHKGRLLFTEDKDELLYNYGIVRCSKKQAERIPENLIVGKEVREYETSVLIKNKSRLEESGFFREAQRQEGNTCVVDRAAIEDMLLYIVKSKGQKR